MLDHQIYRRTAAELLQEASATADHAARGRMILRASMWQQMALGFERSSAPTKAAAGLYGHRLVA